MKGVDRKRMSHPKLSPSKVGGEKRNIKSTSLKSGSNSPAKRFMSGSKPKRG